jgi:hypothetical protein
VIWEKKDQEEILVLLVRREPRDLREQREAKAQGVKLALLVLLEIKESLAHLDLLAIPEALVTKEIKETKEVMVHLGQKENGDVMVFQEKEDKSDLGDLEANVAVLGVKGFLDQKETLDSLGHQDQLGLREKTDQKDNEE